MTTLLTVEAFKHIQSNDSMVVLEGDALKRMQQEFAGAMGVARVASSQCRGER